MKKVSINVSTDFIDFQTTHLSYTFATLRFLFPDLTEAQTTHIGEAYCSFCFCNSSSWGDNNFHGFTINSQPY